MTMAFKELKESFEEIEKIIQDVITRENKRISSNPDSKDSALENIRIAEVSRFTLRLLFEINSNLDSLAVTYRSMLEITKARSGVADHGKKGR